MPRFKEYTYDQGTFVPVHFHKQILPGTFEYTLNYLIDEVVDLSVFEGRYANDDTGRPAYDPALLLKIVLFAYSRGIVSSRKIEGACQENVVFMALSANTRPHFTTIADFISRMDTEISEIFRDVLLYCDQAGLIGKEMFAIDGCKIPSNASKEWSGTKAEFQKKRKKMEEAVRRILKKHRNMDAQQKESDPVASEEQFVKTLKGHVKKLKDWLSENDDKPGRAGPRKSNITDNESAKMKSSHGIIQGYDGVAVVDDRHQVIVHAEAFGEAQEHELLKPMIDGTRENFQVIGTDENVFEKTQVTADAGFHTEANMKMLAEEGIDGYVADTRFRKRDPRFADVGRYKERHRREQRKHPGPELFKPADFSMSSDQSHCICPAGQRLYRNGGNVVIRGYKAVSFRGPKSACGPCALRIQCLMYPDRTEVRQVHFFEGRANTTQETFTAKMKRKIDSIKGRLIYGKRLGTVEPVFGNMRYNIGLSRFTLRGRQKVNTQWQLFCLVHNIFKIQRYGPAHA